MWFCFICLPQLQSPHWCWIIALLSVPHCSWVLEPVVPRCWGRFQEGVAVAAAQTDLTGRWESDLNGLTGWHSTTIVCSGSLINSLQSAVFAYNIPSQPRNANLRVTGRSTIFRQTSWKFCQGSEFPTLFVFIPSTEILSIPDGNTSGRALNIYQRLYWWVLCQG